MVLTYGNVVTVEIHWPSLKWQFRNKQEKETKLMKQ